MTVSRKESLFIACAAVVCSSGAAVAGAKMNESIPGQDMRPNILFIFPDQHRPDWLGCNEKLPLCTPNIDRLCRDGVRFTRAYCASPLCAPSRATLATGRDYDRCGVIDNGQSMPLDLPTFYAALCDAGYRVCGVGKFDLHKPTHDWGTDGSHLLKEWGFTDGIDNEGKLDASGSYRKAGRPRGPYMQALYDAGQAELYLEEHVNIQNTGRAYTTRLPESLYCDNWIADNGLSILKTIPRNTPWFMQVNFNGPHSPFDVTPAMRARWQNTEFPSPIGESPLPPDEMVRVQQNYAAMIENIDQQLGRYLDLLKERGELDHTLIVYASDHGEMLGDHGLMGKSIWRESSSGIPLMVAGPGVARGKVTDALTSLIDLAATFLDYGGTHPLADSDARSLRPVLEGRTDRHREAVVCGLREWRMAFDGRFKLVTGVLDGPLLFDLQNDPNESRNMYGQYPEQTAVLRAHLEKPASTENNERIQE